MKTHRNFILDFFYQIYSYREYLKQSVLRDLRTKYKRSALGYLWTMLHPLAMMAILAVVFSHIMRIPVENYAVFLFAGLLPWNYFSSTSMMSIANIRANARLIGQIPVPKYIFLVSLTFSNMVNLLLAIVPLLVIMLATGRHVPWTMLLLPVVFLPIYFLTTGLSLVLSASNVFFDDTLHLAEVALQGLYFMSPILYHRELLPARLIDYLVLNPLFCQIEFMRNVIYDGTIPDLYTFGINLVASFLFLVAGLYFFKKSEDKFLYFV